MFLHQFDDEVAEARVLLHRLAAGHHANFRDHGHRGRVGCEVRAQLRLERIAVRTGDTVVDQDDCASSCDGFVCGKQIA